MKKFVAALTAASATAVLTLVPLISSAEPIEVSDLNPFRGASLFVNKESAALRLAAEWRSSRPADAVLIERIGEQPEVSWFGDWNQNIRQDAADATRRVRASGALPVFVAYNIPQRDCGSYSAGGATNAANYTHWIEQFAQGIERGPAVVILEPDALAGMDCLDPNGQRERLELLRQAVTTFAGRNISVYIDAGHARWHEPSEVARRLREAGIESAVGFTLNVSNFHPTEENIRFGETVSQGVGGRGFIVDTSRNGVGTADPSQWCNPSGQSLGQLPTTRTQHPLVHAFLWIKRPGESDGTCNGGPAAGQWWAEYALELAKRQPQHLAMSQSQ